MTVWICVLCNKLPDARCGAFVDDRSIRAHSRAVFDRAVALTDELDGLSGSWPNREKTGVMVTRLPLEWQLHDSYHGLI